jgi:predicted nucleotidyltransferase
MHALAGPIIVHLDPQRLDDVARRHGILLLLQFGSTLTAHARPDSDLDLAVLLEHAPRTLTAHAELVADPQALATGREVDVALLNRADPLFLRKITERCELLYRCPRRLHELKMYAFKRYQDHRRYLALERAYVTRMLGHAAR